MAQCPHSSAVRQSMRIGTMATAEFRFRKRSGERSVVIRNCRRITWRLRRSDFHRCRSEYWQRSWNVGLRNTASVRTAKLYRIFVRAKSARAETSERSDARYRAIDRGRKGRFFVRWRQIAILWLCFGRARANRYTVAHFEHNAIWLRCSKQFHDG